ncbi:glycosyltransferase [Pseudolysobacter antarcticus]|uniref:glycosyltransferase n=1 Tax=Pseudolysobacter antarcticus TaxID=2511995 RepID=UPI0013EAD9DF|nr:glycosyltransferase [Pseudolysobacter antarcticus]
MKILCVATKSPWPPRDGGRLVLWLTLQGLASAGHEIFLVAPADTSGEHGEDAAAAMRAIGITPYLVSVRRRSWFGTLVGAIRHSRALSVMRHHRSEVESAVAECIARHHPHAVHAEQLQALANCLSAQAAGIPIVLRMQNVESAIWRQVAFARRGGILLAIEANRLRVEERFAMASAGQTITLTPDDARDLREIARPQDRDRTHTIAPAFPKVWPTTSAVEGEPAFVLSGSAGWWPNAQGTRWFLRKVWPRFHAAHPHAKAIIFGGDVRTFGAGVVWRAAPVESVDAFPAGAIVIVPLHVGSGIRMRILEAWARGLAVIATSIAARGLEVLSGRELLIADTPTEFFDALVRLTSDAELRASLIAGGRAYLASRHASANATDALLAVYARAQRAGALIQ